MPELLLVSIKATFTRTVELSGTSVTTMCMCSVASAFIYNT